MAWEAIAGAAASAYSEWRQAAMQRDFTSGQARTQMDFQRDMSNTAHQREIADLAKAGLNPILSATGGAGLSTPSGASGSGGQGRIPDLGSTALANKRLAQELENMYQVQTNVMQDTALKDQQTAVARQTAAKLLAETDGAIWDAKSAQTRYHLLGTELPGRKVEKELDESQYGAWMRALQRANPIRIFK